MFDLALHWDRPAHSGPAPSTHTLRVRLMPEHPTASTRGIPLRIAVALDTSSSMQGEKLEQAAVACRVLLAQLRPEDRLSLAGFASEVTPLLQAFPGGPAIEASAEAALSRLTAFGVTRTDLALAWLREALPEEPDTLRLGVLITDGHPTDPLGASLPGLGPLIGMAQMMSAVGLTLCTVGLGNAANFHTAFLVELSDQGRGAFLYADTPEALAPQLRDRLQISQSVAEEALTLEWTPRLPGVKVTGCCRLRPEFLPYELERGQEVLSLGAVAADSPTDLLLAVEAPPLGFGEPLGLHDVLDLRIHGTGDAPLQAIASLNYTSSYTEAQRIDANVNADRMQWDINTYSKALLQANDPKQTADLLSQIAFTARKAGQEELAQNADRQLADLKQTGRLDAHGSTGLLTASRSRGGAA